MNAMIANETTSIPHQIKVKYSPAIIGPIWSNTVNTTLKTNAVLRMLRMNIFNRLGILVSTTSLTKSSGVSSVTADND